MNETMKANRRKTIDLCSGFSPAQFAAREGDEWSAGDVARHIVMAETGTSKLIRKVVREKGATLPPYPANDASIRINLHPPSGPMKAPEIATPVGDAPPMEEIIKSLAESRDAMEVSLSMLCTIDPTAATWPHPLFGQMNLYEWPAITVLLHEPQHHQQLEAIRKRLGI